MWDFSLFAQYLFAFTLFFFNYPSDIFSLKPLSFYTQQEEESFTGGEKRSTYTVAGTDQHKKDYRMYLGISAMNDKFCYPHYKEVWCLLGPIVT